MARCPANDTRGNMDEKDRSLGMNRPITRRDFLNGVSVAIAGSILPRHLMARQQEFAPEKSPDYYPPALTGMRGDHRGSPEVAHQMRDRHGWDLSGAVNTGENYDLVVVGGGISGLA